MENDKECKLGQHKQVHNWTRFNHTQGKDNRVISFLQLVVPPSWIVKKPTSQTFKSSLKASPLKAKNGKTFKVVEEDETNNNNTEEKKATNIKEFYCIKPIPDTNCTPILVFLNPKSGGNQGVKLMQKFQWLLNPRQVFDLTKGGPGPAIDLFRWEDNTFCLILHLKPFFKVVQWLDSTAIQLPLRGILYRKNFH